MIKRASYLLFVLPLVAFVLLLNARAHVPGDVRTTIAQLDFLGTSLDHGAADRMQAIFPEGYVFTWALYGLASAQVAGQLRIEDPRRTRFLHEAHRAIEHVDSDLARATFDAHLDPPFGAFYTSWSLYVRATLIRAAGPDGVDSELVERFRDDCEAFAAALVRSNTPFLPSYSASAWPADTAVGIAALGIHDQVFAPRFGSAIERWVADVRSRLDDELGAISHAAATGTGVPREGVRGSSLALMSRVLVDADEAFAREQYAILRRYFVDLTWGVPGVREFPRGYEGSGDIDSGPILFGYSGPAVVVGAAAARVHGDATLAGTLLSAVEVGGLPIQLGGGRRYAAGMVPVGDAFIAWARSSRPGVATTEWAPLIAELWAVPAHLISMIGVGILLLPPLRWIESHRSRRGPTV